MKKKEIITEQDITNNTLLNVITPMGLDFTKNSLSVGENMGKVYGITKYPSKVDIGWLSKITNLQSTIVSIGFNRSRTRVIVIKKRGHALFMVGDKRLHINFVIPEYKLDYIGNVGG